MTTEDNKTLVRLMTDELINRRNLHATERFFAPDYIIHDVPADAPQGPEGIRQLIASFIDAFPDVHCGLDQLVAEEDKVAAVMTWAGTHQGELMGVPPTGRPVRVRGIAVYRIRDGKISEQWETSDLMGLMQQLGAAPV